MFFPGKRALQFAQLGVAKGYANNEPNKAGNDKNGKRDYTYGVEYALPAADAWQLSFKVFKVSNISIPALPSWQGSISVGASLVYHDRLVLVNVFAGIPQHPIHQPRIPCPGRLVALATLGLIAGVHEGFHRVERSQVMTSQGSVNLYLKDGLPSFFT